MEKCITSSNGIEIYTYRSDYLHSFCLNFYVRAGLMYENEDEHGISHFWEHMVFKNIDKLYGGKLHEFIDRSGLKFNGCTYKDFVYFWVSGSSSHFRDGVDVLTKLLAPMCVDRKCAELEKKRVKREIRESNVGSSLDKLAVSKIWKGTPLSAMIAGTAGSVNRITLKKLSESHSKFLNSDNIFFYATGAFSDEDIDYLKSEAEKYQLAEPETERRCNMAAVPEGFGKRDCSIHLKNDDNTLVRFSFDVVTDRYSTEELNLIYDLLFSGETARFYRTMSDENGLIYDFDAFWDKYSNIGVLYFEFEIEQKNLYRALELVAGIIVGLRQSITEADLQNVLPSYIDNADTMLDDPSDLNWNMAYNHILGRKVNSVEEDKDRYSTVTPERLMQVANEIFTRDNFTFSAKCDLKKTDENQIRDILKAI